MLDEDRVSSAGRAPGAQGGMSVYKNPWFALVIGSMVGLVLGYILAERQPIPPAKAMAAPQAAQQGLPDGHPPIEATGPGGGGAEAAKLAQQAAELEGALAQSPDDPRLMIALGNLYFDAGRWTESRLWYERGIEAGGGDANVLTDLAVVYRNLKQPERSLDFLGQALQMSPTHWQAIYNQVVVLHFDLHRHDDAAAALQRLKQVAATNPDVPDLSALETEVMGS